MLFVLALICTIMFMRPSWCNHLLNIRSPTAIYNHHHRWGHFLLGAFFESASQDHLEHFLGSTLTRHVSVGLCKGLVSSGTAWGPIRAPRGAQEQSRVPCGLHGAIYLEAYPSGLIGIMTSTWVLSSLTSLSSTSLQSQVAKWCSD